MALLVPTSAAFAGSGVTGKYDFTESGQWWYRGDSGRFRDSGTAKLTPRKLVTRTEGRDGMRDKAVIHFTRPIDRRAQHQIADGFGRVKTIDDRGRVTWSDIALRAVIERLSDGRVRAVAVWEQHATRDEYRGAYVRGEGVAWKR